MQQLLEPSSAAELKGLDLLLSSAVHHQLSLRAFDDGYAGICVCMLLRAQQHTNFIHLLRSGLVWFCLISGQLCVCQYSQYVSVILSHVFVQLQCAISAVIGKCSNCTHETRGACDSTASMGQHVCAPCLIVQLTCLMVNLSAVTIFLMHMCAAADTPATAAATDTTLSDERVVFQTQWGDIEFAFLPHVRSFASSQHASSRDMSVAQDCLEPTHPNPSLPGSSDGNSRRSSSSV